MLTCNLVGKGGCELAIAGSVGQVPTGSQDRGVRKAMTRNWFLGQDSQEGKLREQHPGYCQKNSNQSPKTIE